jgi:hypothetical protein
VEHFGENDNQQRRIASVRASESLRMNVMEDPDDYRVYDDEDEDPDFETNEKKTQEGQSPVKKRKKSGNVMTAEETQPTIDDSTPNEIEAKNSLKQENVKAEKEFPGKFHDQAVILKINITD